MYIRTNPVLRGVFKPLIFLCEWFGTKYPKMLVKVRYFVRFQKILDLKNPKTLNEKILYLTLCTDTSLWTKLADKYRVREYIKEKGLEESLVKLYGMWENVNDCRFSELPERFVLKCNHGSGDVVIVDDKSKFDEKKIMNTFAKELAKPYGALEGGIHYMRIKPCLIAEEMLDINAQCIDSKSLIDYKIWCINGKPKYIWTCYNRSEDGMENSLFDCEWNDCSHYLKYNNHYKKPSKLMPKPECLESLLKVAETLAEGHPILRCDLYIVNNRVYFGEMTFTSNGGMMFNYTEEFQMMCGKEIILPYSTPQYKRQVKG